MAATSAPARVFDRVARTRQESAGAARGSLRRQLPKYDDGGRTRRRGDGDERASTRVRSGGVNAARVGRRDTWIVAQATGASTICRNTATADRDGRRDAGDECVSEPARAFDSAA
ncbi:hypothetical protein Bcep1808_0752 [Burkholderia vietnamiensis G4]|uniref:Uncharacterized protein n=1 Tax=Burkholderia vietnamiensis (strain G4 / LMG 22486) TaxID=269482 RepID=A4JBW1_BURVG|nr:hypothetical protein Bcep1808_0752 [Burkholderia vietnamiensis G4]